MLLWGKKMTALWNLCKRFARTFLSWSTLIVCVGLLAISLILKIQQDKDLPPDSSVENKAAIASQGASSLSVERQVAELDNPKTDGWQSEAVADQVKHQLDDLLKLATGSQRDETEKYDAFVATNYLGQRIVPVDLQSIYKDGFV